MKSLLLASSLALVSLPAAALVNGTEEAESSFPFTARLYVLGTHLCTGTFLNDTTVLTARHCIAYADPTGNVRVDSGAQQSASVNVFYLDEGFDPALPPQLGYETDLALVVFPAGTGKGRGIGGGGYPALATDEPLPGDWLYLLGYGGTDMTGAGAGVLRSGAHQIMFVDPADMSWVALPGEQNVAPGDSGSAGYIDGKVAGVATLAGDILGLVKIGAYRSIFDDKAKGLFERAIHCSNGPCAAEFRPN